MAKDALILHFPTSVSNSNSKIASPTVLIDKKRELLEAYIDGKITLNGIMDTMYQLGKNNKGE
jgi:hypothetical protein